MYESFVKPALDMYDVDYLQILPKQSGYRNEIYPVVLADSSTIQLTFYKSDAGIKDRIKVSNQVSEFLASRGFPARVRRDKRILKLDFGSRTVYGGLYNYLPGETIPWEAYTRKHIKLLGKTLSDLHAELLSFKLNNNANVIDQYEDILGRMRQYFSSGDVTKAMRDKLELKLVFKNDSYSRLLSGCRGLPGQQQLHMDFVRGNVLFSENHGQKSNLRISGILDFEKTGVGHPIVDVARTLAFLLVDCKYKDSSEVWRLFVHSGYQKQGGSSLPTTGPLLDQLVGFFLIHDLYKFLKHNPYEALHQNEHFNRTKNLLIRRGMIDLV